MKHFKAFLVLAIMLATCYASYGAVVINSQGSSLTPVSVPTSSPVAATEVLACNPRRIDWTLISETVALRCVAGTYNAASGACTAPASTATASKGFYLPSGQLVKESQVFISMSDQSSFSRGEDFAKVEIDCYPATGSSATNVDTWEETLPNSLP